MNNSLLTAILVTALSSNALFVFLQFMITRNDSKKKNPDIENIKGALMSILAERLT